MRIPSVMAMVALCAAPWTCAGQAADAAVWAAKGRADLDRGYPTDARGDVEKAIALEPDHAAWHALLARVYIALLQPGMFPDQAGMLPKAKAEAQRALELSPNDAGALLMSGKVEAAASQHARPMGFASSPAAKKYFLKALQADPNLAEAHYELAHQAMLEDTMPLMLARQKSHVPVGHKGWVSDSDARRVLRFCCEISVQDGISHANAALAIEPGYEKAMRTLSVLMMARSDMRENEAEYDADNREADEWNKKADAIFASRPRVESKAVPGTGIIGGIAGSLPTRAPVPPPEPK